MISTEQKVLIICKLRLKKYLQHIPRRNQFRKTSRRLTLLKPNSFTKGLNYQNFYSDVTNEMKKKTFDNFILTFTINNAFNFKKISVMVLNPFIDFDFFTKR